MKESYLSRGQRWFGFSFQITVMIVLMGSFVSCSKPENMVLIPAGKFMMGSAESNQDGERPVHEVSLDSFYMDMYEVTQAAYEGVMEKNPSHFKGADRPVEQVTWQEAKQYCQKLEKRLPTEAEWEYAARGGTITKYSWGDEFSEDYGWFSKETHPVGGKKPNDFGLYDMVGNVDEWVQDWYGYDYYKSSPTTNPQGPSSGKLKVRRGGNLGFSTARGFYIPTGKDSSLGFRCVLNVPSKS